MGKLYFFWDLCYVFLFQLEGDDDLYYGDPHAAENYLVIPNSWIKSDLAYCSVFFYPAH